MNVAVHTTEQTESHQSVSIHADAKSTTYDNLWQKMEYNRFGIIGMLMMVVTIVGGIAVAYALDKTMYHFTIAALPAMMVEVLILAIASMRSIVIASIISCLVSLLVIIF